MTARNQLPPYFQKYLDQRFNMLKLEIGDVKNILEGDDGLVTQVKKNTKWRENIAAKLAVVATVGSFFLTLMVETFKNWLNRMKL